MPAPIQFLELREIIASESGLLPDQYHLVSEADGGAVLRIEFEDRILNASLYPDSFGIARLETEVDDPHADYLVLQTLLDEQETGWVISELWYKDAEE